MPAQFRRIETLLSSPMSGASEAELTCLVDGGITEASDLDFKQTLYKRNDEGKRDLAGDVAAMANTIGGVIVLGIEDEDGVAIRRTPVELSEGEQLRMRQVIAELVAPVPDLDVFPVPSSESRGLGYYLLAVPRSPLAPHAVRVGVALRYPRRDGARTRYLSESEVADAYRNRFTAAGEQVARLRLVHQEGVEQLETTEHVWLSVSLVPNTPGEMPLRYGTLRRVKEWLDGRRVPTLVRSVLKSGTFEARAAVRRVRLSQLVDRDTGRSRYAHVEMYTDGSGFAAVPASFDGGPSEEWGISDSVVFDERVVGEIAALLDTLAAHAVEQAHCVGEAAVRAELTEEAGEAGVPRRMRLCHARQHGIARGLPGTRAISHAPASEHSVDLVAVMGSPAELLVATRLLATELLQAFGLPEVLQIDPEGRVRHQYVDSEWQRPMRAWAESLGVELVGTTVEGEVGS